MTRFQRQAELDLRRRLAELEPTLDNQLLLAATSLRSQRSPYPVAAQVIEELAVTASDAPDYHVLAAQLAPKLNQMAIAAGHFQQAATLEPTHRLLELNLAVLRLGSRNTTTTVASVLRLPATLNPAGPRCFRVVTPSAP